MSSPRLRRFARKLLPLGIAAAFLWLMPASCWPRQSPPEVARTNVFPSWLVMILLGAFGVTQVGLALRRMVRLRWPATILLAYAVVAPTTILLYVGWALLSGGGVPIGGAPAPEPIPWEGMPRWLERIVVCLGIPSIWATLDVGVAGLSARRFVPILCRALVRQGLAALCLAMMWSFAWGDRRAWDWIHARWPWIVPAFVLALLAVLALLLMTRSANPRRVRRHAHAAPPEPIPCPRCEVPMRLGHRHAECRSCGVEQSLPRDQWVCECGHSLRGVDGSACPECGESFEEDQRGLTEPGTAFPATRQELLEALRRREAFLESMAAGCYPLRPMTLTATGPVVWIDGRLVAPEEAMVSVYDHGLLYGDGIFEGIRVYGGRIFKMKSHLDRLWGGCEAIRLTPALSRAELEAALREAVSASGLKDAYIRLVLTRGKGSLGLNPNHCPKSGTIIIVDRIHLYPPEMYEQGMPIIVAKRPRIPAECLDPAIKSLNYLNNILAKVEAIDAGVHEAIMLNTQGFVSECTGDNIFVIKGGAIATPPVSAGILRGVTRRFVIDTLAPALGLKVAERAMRIEEVLAADEVFLTGTAAEVIGVGSVDGRKIGTGVVGPITKRLEAEFKRIVAKDAPED